MLRIHVNADTRTASRTDSTLCAGADLRALLTEAQLAAAHEALEDSERAAPQTVPAITHAHLHTAFDAARPSVTPAEAARLAALYARFRQSRDPAWGADPAKGGQRATLA